MSEQVTVGTGTPSWNDYLIVDGLIVGVRSATGSAPLWGSTITWGSGSAHPFNWTSASATATYSYFVLDHLGSVAVITNGSGTVTQRLSYDAWGKQRNANGTDAACGAISPLTTRGYTNQEEMTPVCLVNLNARVYNPSIGKFLSADPLVGNPFTPNATNRYAYVLNNPLSSIDPTGNYVVTYQITICTAIILFYQNLPNERTVLRPEDWTCGSNTVSFDLGPEAPDPSGLGVTSQPSSGDYAPTGQLTGGPGSADSNAQGNNTQGNNGNQQGQGQTPTGANIAGGGMPGTIAYGPQGNLGNCSHCYQEAGNPPNVTPEQRSQAEALVGPFFETMAGVGLLATGVGAAVDAYGAVGAARVGLQMLKALISPSEDVILPEEIRPPMEELQELEPQAPAWPESPQTQQPPPGDVPPK